MTPSAPRVFETAEEVAAEAASIVAATVRSHDAPRIVLAGGTTPRRCHELLAAMGLPWGKVTILFGDEWCLPADDPRTNFSNAASALLTHVTPATVHRIPAELGPEEAARRYTPIVAAGRLDLVLLGIGTDGHTASLFPGNAALQATGLVAPVHGSPKAPSDRVTLTLGALRAGARVVVLATGKDKHEALELAKQGKVPAGLVGAEMLVDRAAAGA